MFVALPKDVVHDKSRAFTLMLPKENKELERLRINNALLINQLYENGNVHLLSSAEKFE